MYPGTGIEHQTPIFNLLDLNVLLLDFLPCVIGNYTITNHFDFVLNKVFIMFLFKKKDFIFNANYNVLNTVSS